MTTVAIHHLLIWLPSPMGDAILCTPAMQALREALPQTRITGYGNRVNQELLAHHPALDDYVIQTSSGLWAAVRQLRDGHYSNVVLFKNSFGSALTCCLAGIPQRIGYRREGRGLLLTAGPKPLRSANGRYQPGSMVDYYLKLCESLDTPRHRRLPELSVTESDNEALEAALPEVTSLNRPLAVLVPGGAFGPSKCWSPQRYAQVADWLSQEKQAQVVISVAPNPAEQAIAQVIEETAQHPVINLAQRPIALGPLKALIGRADLVIANDTGPRHMAIALRRKVITLFGPNNPAWTQTGWGQEIQLVGKAPCAPCGKPQCTAEEHLCMNDITVAQVCDAAQSLWEAI